MFGGWRDRKRDERGRSGGGGWEKGGKNVMTVVKGGRKGGVLEARGDERRGGSGRRGEKTGKLQGVGM